MGRPRGPNYRTPEDRRQSYLAWQRKLWAYRDGLGGRPPKTDVAWYMASYNKGVNVRRLMKQAMAALREEMSGES